MPLALARPTAVLTDIEGTTSSISFVHDVLFPYARAELPAWLRQHADEPAVAEALAAVAHEANVAADDIETLGTTLQRWIDEDRKATPLKTLQGLIWEAGYLNGTYRAHVYADAAEALRSWHAAGLSLHVYSSGSRKAQQLFFAHSTAGDLTPLFSQHFDTTIGSKRAPASYQAIARQIALEPAAIVFLSDIAEELDAAAETGMATVWVVRDQTARQTAAHPVAEKLTDIHWQT